jgi:hypothetical protein
VNALFACLIALGSFGVAPGPSVRAPAEPSVDSAATPAAGRIADRAPVEPRAQAESARLPNTGQAPPGIVARPPALPLPLTYLLRQIDLPAGRARDRARFGHGARAPPRA